MQHRAQDIHRNYLQLMHTDCLTTHTYYVKQTTEKLFGGLVNCVRTTFYSPTHIKTQHLNYCGFRYCVFKKVLREYFYKYCTLGN